MLVHLKCNVGPTQRALEVTIDPVDIPLDDGPYTTSTTRIAPPKVSASSRLLGCQAMFG